ncbi:c-type cytochrome [Pseudorhodoplanes sp.]|uniref:c-type cytochrome n=1 Tax=Pseudorhodoplanes sp. TaxID=1934341 RepID=UPI003919AF02
MPLTVRAAAPAFLAGAILLYAGLPVQSAPAQNAQRGAAIARAHCANCHAIDKLSPSALKDAPPFRDLHKMYPVENLQEALAEGIVTGHPGMPEFRFDAAQVNDFIVFLNTLR